MAKDPGCDMEVDEEKTPAGSQHMGKTYHFCAPSCKRAFDEDPAKYTGTGRHEMAGHARHKM
jgi:YHS domain-containing protein